MFEKGLFVFRRDLRLVDNVGLNQALKQCNKLYVCFIFTPEQVTNNDFKSNNAVQFMIESLDELRKTLRAKGGELYTFYGKQDQVISDIIYELKIDAVFFNKDYSPYALKRDKQIKQLCSKKQISCNIYRDYYLYEPGTIITSTGDAYKKYTPFYRQVIELDVLPIEKEVNKPISKTTKNLPNIISLSDAFSRFTVKNENILVRGGRKEALLFLQNALEQQKDYLNTRDYFEKKKENISFISVH